MNFNKLCELEDFADPELAEVIREVCAQKAAYFPAGYPVGYEARKDWEVAMSVRALRHFGALGPDSVILGVAAGTEDTIFYLTRHARQVFVTDRYLGAGEWGHLAPIAMLVEPGFLAPFDFDPNRLVVQHMDGRSLRYPDGTFDAVFSSGSIEHFGELIDVANAAYEMGRVLKPGGVLVLSTEFRISGPTGGIGWPHATLLLSAENLARYIVEASGLEAVDELRTDLSDATLATVRDMQAAVGDYRRRAAGAGARGVPEYAHWDFPHILLSQDGYQFGSVHLTLRRPETWPAVDNEWARPPRHTIEAIAAFNAEVLAAGDPAAEPPVAAASAPAPAAAAAAVEVEGEGDAEDAPAPKPMPRAPAVVGSWEEQKAAVATLVDVATYYRRDAGAHLAGVLGLAEQASGQLEGIARDFAAAQDHLATVTSVRAEIARQPDRPALGELLLAPPEPLADRSRWKRCQVNLGGDTPVVVVVDGTSTDPVSGAFAHGEPPPYWHLVDLMLEQTRPGDLVVDLGAHVGTFALAAAAGGRRVVAVEASAANAALLRASVRANHLFDLRVVTAAAGDAPGTVGFSPDGLRGRVVTPTEGGVAPEAVPVVTVDELLAELGFVAAAFVKIDVEGSEVAAVRRHAAAAGGGGRARGALRVGRPGPRPLRREPGVAGGRARRPGLHQLLRRPTPAHPGGARCHAAGGGCRLPRPQAAPLVAARVAVRPAAHAARAGAAPCRQPRGGPSGPPGLPGRAAPGGRPRRARPPRGRCLAGMTGLPA